MPTTATAWLNDNPGDVDVLEKLVADTGLNFGVFTDLPPQMKQQIADQLSESFQQPYWADIAKTTGGDAERYLRTGLQDGWSIRRIANTMAAGNFQGGTVKYARGRARNIARTEAANALNGARKNSMDALSEDLGPQIPMRPSWLSVLGNTTRDAHAGLDGVPADANGMWNLAGYKIPWPGHFSLPAKERCNCQCTVTLELGMTKREADELIEQYQEREQKSETRKVLWLALSPPYGNEFEEDEKYTPGQPRDDHGRFAGGGVGGSAPDTGGSYGGAGDSGVSVQFHVGAEDALSRIVGDRGSIDRLCGAPEGSSGKVSVSYSKASDALIAEYTDDSTGVYWQTKIKSDNTIEIMGASVKEKGTGLGTKIAYEQIKAAQEAGFDRVNLSADRAEGMNGHYTWPRLGFGGGIPRQWQKKYKNHSVMKNLRGPKSMSNLMKTKEGRNLWKSKGVTVQLSMSLDPGNYQFGVLKSYAKAKGL